MPPVTSIKWLLEVKNNRMFLSR